MNAGVVFGIFVGALSAAAVFYFTTLSFGSNLIAPTYTNLKSSTPRWQGTRFPKTYGNTLRQHSIHRPLPLRVPGSSLGIVPPDDVPLHTNPLPVNHSPKHWLMDQVFFLWIADRLSPIESQESFRTWWDQNATNDRKRLHVGRHRHQDETWRKRWAQYATQGWPTLATTGHATDVIANIQPEAYFDITRYDALVG